jgi:hypothetical protein
MTRQYSEFGLGHYFNGMHSLISCPGSAQLPFPFGCQRRSKIRQFRRVKVRQFDEGTSLRSSRPPDDVAMTLAAIGLGGLLAYAVGRRTNEIGVRMALGAASSDVVRMVLRDSLWMVGTGILIGLPCAYALSRVLRTALFQPEPVDPPTAALSLLTLFAVALLAAWVPARRAARIDPMTALRQE